jgi:argininosuccinate lyase
LNAILDLLLLLISPSSLKLLVYFSIYSIDAISDRDFVLEFLAANSIAAVHLSRIGEEWVLWASEEFGFLTPSDSVSTGSSIMPQKKNPDPMELVRGKSARVVGDLMTVLVLCKGLPQAYNRDLQVALIVVFMLMLISVHYLKFSS